MKEFTEEFYRLSIRLGHTDEGEKVVARYVNGLKYAIQDELSLLRFIIVREAYQLALKNEETLMRKSIPAKAKTIARGGRTILPKGQSSRTKNEFV